MAINKVVYGGDTLIDLTSDTVTPPKLKIGAVAHAANGVAISGELAGVYYGETEPSSSDTAVWIDPSGDGAEVFYPLDAYPIGSIYQSINSTSPAELFGGSWVRIEGQFLLAATDGGSSGAAQAAGNEGGAATVTLTANQSGLRAHHHGIKNTKTGASGSAKWVIDSSGEAGETVITNNAAQNATEAHNNMPPYLAVYMWQRIA